MDVLVVGSGGREHALVWGLHRSPSIDTVYCTPGNAGISRLAECWSLPPGDLQGIVAAARERLVDLVVVGPEAPLTAGLADVFAEEGVPCFGPSRKAAVIEGSKAFAKAFMARHDIPTAEFEVFADVKAAREFVGDPPWGYPLVVKADGLAAGKGAVVCDTPEKAREIVDAAMVDRTFGRAGERIVVEAFVPGVEATVMALCDGERAEPLLPSQDHKTLLEGGEGPNTGGMGAYAPAWGVIDEELLARVSAEILQPTVAGLASEDRAFRGVLYAGLMLSEEGPKVLEFNSRFGDPEAQAVIPLLDEDLGDRLMGLACGEPLDEPLRWLDRSCACVVLAAGGYPGKKSSGQPIEGIEEAEELEDVVVFHAATAIEQGRLVTSGGRVLGVTALGDQLPTAIERAYEAVDRIRFEGMQFRRDIGHRGVQASEVKEA